MMSQRDLHRSTRQGRKRSTDRLWQSSGKGRLLSSCRLELAARAACPCTRFQLVLWMALVTCISSWSIAVWVFPSSS